MHCLFPEDGQDVKVYDMGSDHGSNCKVKQVIDKTKNKIGLTSKQASQVISGRCISMHVGSIA